MPDEVGEEEEPVSIASIRSRFESLAAGGSGSNVKEGVSRNSAGPSRPNRTIVGGISAARPVKQVDPPEDASHTVQVCDPLSFNCLAHPNLARSTVNPYHQ